jgi:hypothetical protein
MSVLCCAGDGAEGKELEESGGDLWCGYHLAARMADFLYGIDVRE